MFYSESFINKVKTDICKIDISPAKRKSINEALASHNPILGEYLRQLVQAVPSWESINKLFNDGESHLLFRQSEEMIICQNLLGDWNYLQETQEVTIRPGAFKFPSPKGSGS